MENKEKLKELKYFILWAIYCNSIAYTKELGEYGIEYIPGIHTIIPPVMKDGLLLLDGKSIARIYANSNKVACIDFHDRYDALIRFIFTVLDVELHRFGSIWVGYPSPDAIPQPVLPATIKDSAPANIPGIDVAQLHRENWEELTHTTPTNPNWSTITTAGGYVFGPGNTFSVAGTSGTGIYNGTYYNITGANTISFPPWNPPWNNEYADTSWMRAPEVNKPRNTPKNPILAEAQRSGVSQAQMEANMRKGRRN